MSHYDYRLFKIPTTDEYIDFKIGFPAPDMLPLDLIRQCAAEKLAETDPELLTYGSIKGYPEFRTDLSKWLASKYDRSVDPETLFVCNGVSGGLMLMCTYFTKPGDTVFIEAPTYFIARMNYRDLGLNVVELPIDEHGLIPSAVEEAIHKHGAPKFLYTIPVCHNPTGRTLPLDRKIALAKLAREHNFLLVADEVYHLLSFPNQPTPPPPIYYMDEEANKEDGRQSEGEDTHSHCVSISSFSKIFAPSLRLGWIQGPQHVIKRIANAPGVLSGGGQNPLVSGIVHRALLNGGLESFLQETRNELLRKATVLQDSLTTLIVQAPDQDEQSQSDQRKARVASLAGRDAATVTDETLLNLEARAVLAMREGVRWEAPSGGYFVLLDLPQGVSTFELLSFARDLHRVNFLSGQELGGGRYENSLRLSFSFYSTEMIEEGVQRLAGAMREFLMARELAKQSAACCSGCL